MEGAADHSKTYHCLMGSAVAPVSCSLCQTLLRAGTAASAVAAASVVEHKTQLTIQNFCIFRQILSFHFIDLSCLFFPTHLICIY